VLAGWRQLSRFGADPMELLMGKADPEHGVVSFVLGTLRCHLVLDPALVKLALESEEWPPLDRGRMAYIGDWYESGLTLHTGEVHAAHRDRMWLPVMEEPWLLDAAVAEAVKPPRRCGRARSCSRRSRRAGGCGRRRARSRRDRLRRGRSRRAAASRCDRPARSRGRRRRRAASGQAS